MKKILAMLLAAALVLSLAACSTGTTSDDGGADSSETPEASPTAEPEETDGGEASAEDASCDIVVIGGGAGMTAALKATEAGASVILLEKEDVLGGNTRLGSSVFNAAGSTMQQEAGTEGATAEAFAEKLTASNTAADPEAIRILAENSGAAAD